MSSRRRLIVVRALMALALASSVAWGSTYVPGTVSSTGLTFGTMLIGGPHASVGGVGGVTQFTADGSVLNSGGSGFEGDPDESGRVYMFDQGGLTDLAAGTAHRGSSTFAMMVWDFGQPITFVRVYPSQDHITPDGPYPDILGGADVMDSSLWGSDDGDNFVLLNDVVSMTPGGVNGQSPTFTFTGPNQPTTIYRGGSTERGTVNSYTYDVTLSTAYRYIGIRASTLTIKGLGVGPVDGDVEIDALATMLPTNACPPSSIVSNFNGTSIPAGRCVWFNSVMKVKNLPTNAPVTIHVTDQSAVSPAFDVPLPDANITFDPNATTATTTFDPVGNAWNTTVPTSYGGNVFISGALLPLPSGLPGGVKPVTWTATFDHPSGVQIQWQWAAAAYQGTCPPLEQIGAKPVDSNALSIYKNSDHAGTPEAIKSQVVGGARGGGGSNFTGSYSGTGSVCID